MLQVLFVAVKDSAAHYQHVLRRLVSLSYPLLMLLAGSLVSKIVGRHYSSLFNSSRVVAMLQKLWLRTKVLAFMMHVSQQHPGRKPSPGRQVTR